MERETQTFETPVDKDVVVIKSYVTGREQRILTNLLVSTVKNMNVDTKGQSVNVPEVNVSLVDKAEDEAFRLVVISIDGHKDGEVIDGKTFSIVDAILDMKLKDSEAVKQKIKEVTEDRGFEDQKKISETNTKVS